MLTAGIVSLLFKLFKQPVVLGYIVAGMMVGPHVLGDAWIGESDNVATWGDIGVLFLLFSLGLEFSFKKLLQVGNTAVIGATTIVVGMMTIGFLAGNLMGWDFINSLFLGGMLCMSSTTIVFKAIDEAGLSAHKFTKVCFGILIVEDLFAVVLMVLLSSIAVKNDFEGSALVFQIFTLLVCLVFWFISGILLIPTFLSKFKKYLNDETLTIFSIGLCLGMVMLAMSAGFSSALGAFVMGSILSETVENCCGFTLEYQVIAENTQYWNTILGPRKVYVKSDGVWKEVGEFPYSEFGAVKMQVWLEEPMDIEAIGTIAQCRLPDQFNFRQTAAAFVTLG